MALMQHGLMQGWQTGGNRAPCSAATDHHDLHGLVEQPFVQMMLLPTTVGFCNWHRRPPRIAAEFVWLARDIGPGKFASP